MIAKEIEAGKYYYVKDEKYGCSSKLRLAKCVATMDMGGVFRRGLLGFEYIQCAWVYSEGKPRRFWPWS